MYLCYETAAKWDHVKTQATLVTSCQMLMNIKYENGLSFCFLNYQSKFDEIRHIFIIFCHFHFSCNLNFGHIEEII